MPTKRIRGVYCSTDSARLVATAPTEPPIMLYCNRNGKYFEVCGDEVALLDESDARLFVETWFGRDSTLYHDEFETARLKRVIQIGTRTYDPNTATCIAEINDIELYRKRTGEYFLRNARSEEIRPIDYDAASEWARDHLSHAQYIAEFGPIENEDDLVQLHVRIPRSTRKKLLREMSRTGKTKERVIQNLLDSL